MQDSPDNMKSSRQTCCSSYCRDYPLWLCLFSATFAFILVLYCIEAHRGVPRRKRRHGSETGQTVYAYTTAGTNDGIESVVWSPDSQLIALSTWGVGIHIWNPFNGQTITFDPGEQVFQLAWSPNGRRIASASPDRMVSIWDVATDKLIYVYNGHTDEVFSVAWSPNGHMLASAGMDNTVQVWPSL